MSLLSLQREPCFYRSPFACFLVLAPTFGSLTLLEREAEERSSVTTSYTLDYLNTWIHQYFVKYQAFIIKLLSVDEELRHMHTETEVFWPLTFCPVRRSSPPTLTKTTIAATMTLTPWPPRPSTSWRREWRSWTYFPSNWRKVYTHTHTQRHTPLQSLSHSVKPLM